MLTDFSVLNKLDRLEKLVLIGSNTVDNIAFVRSMPRLKTLVLTVNVADGDLSACLGIPHVVIKNRKHYSHKNKDFRK